MHVTCVKRCEPRSRRFIVFLFLVLLLSFLPLVESVRSRRDALGHKLDPDKGQEKYPLHPVFTTASHGVTWLSRAVREEHVRSLCLLIIHHAQLELSPVQRSLALPAAAPARVPSVCLSISLS